jgi:HlyD family secretion protein
LDGKLLPYLTANVNFLTGEATNVLLVWNSALRWHPQKDLIAPEFRQPANGAGGSPAGARGTGEAAGSGQPGGESGGGGQGAAPSQIGMLWAAEGNFVKPLPVKLGLTDGTWTEVEGEGLSKGTVVVTGTISAEAAAEEAGANPFIPQIGRRGGPGGAGGAGGGRRGG